MTPRAVLLMVLATAGGLAAIALAATDLTTAEVRTWDGQTWQLTDVSVVTFHTGPAAAPPDAAMPRPLQGAGTGAGPDGPPVLGEAKPAPPVDVREARSLTLYRAGVATRVDLGRVASLAFFRHPIADSQLPPYAAASHVRHAAVAVLTDGSRVDGDYVNLGATFVRGRAFSGRVSIPWTRVELLRFGR